MSWRGALLVTRLVAAALAGGCMNSSSPSNSTQHYLYVLPDDHTLYVYDIDAGHRLVKKIGLPAGVTYVRGLGADPSSHALYVAYLGGMARAKRLLRMDLVTHQIVYDASMPVEVDSFSITPDGRTIYMPDGDRQPNGIWRIVDAATGRVTGFIDTNGHNPHNTIVTSDGTKVLMGGRLSNYVYVADTRNHEIVGQIGPLPNGVRPFTTNGKGTLALITTSGFIGFYVGEVSTGKLLHRVPVPGSSYDPGSGFAPSHGISLSPDEREIYLPDWPNSKVHVFDASGLPTTAPRFVTTIPVHNMVGSNFPCFEANCMKEGWVLHSLDGRFVYVGDAGDVIDTKTRRSVAYLSALAKTRRFLEIDWADGVPVATSTRHGLGHVR